MQAHDAVTQHQFALLLGELTPHEHVLQVEVGRELVNRFDGRRAPGGGLRGERQRHRKSQSRENEWASQCHKMPVEGQSAIKAGPREGRGHG